MKKPLFLSLVTACLCFSGISHSLQAQTSWGNSFNYGTTSGSLVVSNTNSQWTTFTADSNFEMASIWINSNNAMAASTSVNVELYAVDLATGRPTGSALATQVLTSATSGWTQVSGFNYTLTSGTAYAIRLSAASGIPNWQWRLINSNAAAPFDNSNTVQATTGNTDPNWGRGTNNTNPTNVGQAVWMISSSDNKSFGQPYSSQVNANLGSTTAAIGQRFQFKAPDANITLLENVELLLNVSATPPSSPLVVNLLSSTGSILTSGSLDLSSTAAGLGRFTIEFQDAYQLTDEEFYYLAVYTNTGTGNAVQWRGGTISPADNTIIQNATFQGIDGYVVSWASRSDFTTISTTNLNQDYYFSLGLSVIPEPSSLALLTAVGVLGILRRRRKA